MKNRRIVLWFLGLWVALVGWAFGQPASNVPTVGGRETGASARDFIGRLDRNGDGKISVEEAPQWLSAGAGFARADANKDGLLDADEIDAARRAGEQNRSRQQQRRVDRDIDKTRVEMHSNVDYAGTGNPRQQLDLLLPRGRDGGTSLPLLVFIHGGGWQGGDKSSRVPRLASLVSGGRYAAASVNYRLTDEASWPAQIYDCKAAIRWLRANAGQYGIDADRIAVEGSSAGGHLAAMLGVSADRPEVEGDLGAYAGTSSRVTCVIDEWGPTDLLTASEGAQFKRHADPGSSLSKLLGGPAASVPEVARQASPSSYVSAQSVPFLIIHGTADPVVPVDQSQTFHAALKKAGVDSTLILIEGAGHGYYHAEQTGKIVDAFLEKHLYGKAAALKDETFPSLVPARAASRASAPVKSEAAGPPVGPGHP